MNVMNVINSRVRGFSGLAYPVGGDMESVRRFARRAATELNKLSKDRVRIVCRGSSGAILSSATALFMKTEPIIYHLKKKKGETSHQYVPTSGLDFNEDIVVIDDIMCSGETMEAIVEFIKKGSHGRLLAVVLSGCITKSSTLSKYGFENFINITHT